MNKLDKQYQDLLQTILDYGVDKKDRTGTGTRSIFGYTICHNMKDGFPLLTTKKMAFKTMVTEFYENDETQNRPFSKEEFINWIKNNDKFSELYGELGPVYGKQWRSWDVPKILTIERGKIENSIGTEWGSWERNPIDQIAILINDLKTNPDSRRLMVSAWNVGELDQMVLPPCHYGFQVYTRELNHKERFEYYIRNSNTGLSEINFTPPQLDELNIPTRAISLMWNQRSVDAFLGLPFNIASYGLLLEIIAKAVNMVPDQLIGNLGDVHLYSNHVEQAKEQIGRELSLEERLNMVSEEIQKEFSSGRVNLPNFPNTPVWSNEGKMSLLDDFGVPRRTREPFTLPTLNINTEFWPYEGGECGVGPLDAIKVFEAFKNDNFCKCLLEEDIQLGNYQSHPTIKAPLSN